MAINGVGRPSPLDFMMTPEGTEQILEKVESGCSDREIYRGLHCGPGTFRKWRDANIEAYDEAKSNARKTMLGLAESALASKLQVRELTETEVTYDEQGNIKSKKVKTKQLDVDSLTAMFIAKAANPELYNRSEYQRLQIDSEKGDSIKEAIDTLIQYDVKKYDTPEIEAPDVSDL